MLVVDVVETTPSNADEKAATANDIVISSVSQGFSCDIMNVETRIKTREVIVIKPDKGEVEDDKNNDVNDTATVALRSLDRRGAEVWDGNDDETVDDVPMTATLSTEGFHKIHMPSDKEYPSSSAFANIEADDFFILSRAPWFDVEVLIADVLINQYAVDILLPGDIPFEWTQSWCWSNQFACSDNYLVRRRCEGLAASRRKFCENIV